MKDCISGACVPDARYADNSKDTDPLLPPVAMAVAEKNQSVGVWSQENLIRE